MPMALLGDLRHATLVAGRVVVPDHALLLDVQDVVEPPTNGTNAVPSSAAGSAAGVVLWNVDGRENAERSAPVASSMVTIRSSSGS